MATALSIPFHGDTIPYIEDETGEPFVVMKPVCERLGLDWRAQQRKLSGPKTDWTVAFKATVGIARDAKERDMLCLHMPDFLLWVASLVPSRVPEELRETLILYRRECKQVLWTHFMQKQWQLEDKMVRARGFMLAHNPRWGKIAHLQAAKVNRVMVYHHINLSFTKTLAIIEEMEASGAISKADWHEETVPSPARVMSGLSRSGPPLMTDGEYTARHQASRTDKPTPLEAILDGQADDPTGEVH